LTASVSRGIFGPSGIEYADEHPIIPIPVTFALLPGSGGPRHDVHPEAEAGVSSRVVSLLAAVLLLAVHRAEAQRVDLLVPLPELEARAQRDSLDPVAQYDAALGYWVGKRYDDAERLLRRTVAIEPKFAPGYLALAYLPYARRPQLWKLDEDRPEGAWADTLRAAARLYRRAFILDPMVDLKVYALVMPPRPALVVGFNANRTYVALVRGFEHFWDGQYEQSLADLQRVLDEFGTRHADDVPDALLWYHGLAAAHVLRFDTALADFHLLLDRALKREQADSLVHTFRLESNEVRYVLATLYLHGQRPDEAMALYQESLTNDLGLYMAHAQLAGILEERGQWAEAIAERRRAVDTSPEDPSLQFDLGRTLARSRDFPEAAEILSGAMEANPLNTRIPYTLGLVYLRLGDQTRARQVLERFVATAPSRFSTQVNEVRRQLAGLPQ
jgi:tetratricopeptide (TPR) repeat protein